jgi:peptidoglycan/xylan/chitin deacetylase (PgdA/CDA1 family)
MKSTFAFALVAAGPAFAVAHQPFENHYARQAAADISLSLTNVNPTAIPTSLIVAGTLYDQTAATFATPAPSATPAGFASAPPLPNSKHRVMHILLLYLPVTLSVSGLDPKKYPTLDVIPLTDSPEVQQWKAEVAASGIKIPDFSPTTAATGCGGVNAAAAADTSRCWWTCGGCVRGTDITTCPKKLQWGLTYDDGPAQYTPNLLQYLDEQKLKATFFVVGSRAISYPQMLRAEYIAGHQIAVHTWSHHELTSMTNDQIIAELGWSRKIIKDVLGVTPNFWRPPFGDIDDRVRAISIAMGLTPVMWTRISPTATYDTGDFGVTGGKTTVSQVLQNWQNIIANATAPEQKSGFIVLEHDLFEQSVEIATGYILPDALARQPRFEIMPVSQCLNLQLSDAYVETNNNSTHPPAISAVAASGTSAVVINTLSSGASGAGQATGGGKTTTTGASGNTNTASGSNPSGTGSAAQRAAVLGSTLPLALASALAGVVLGAGALFM